MTKRFLEEHNVAFIEHNIDEQPEFIENLKAEGFLATPVVKLPDGNAFTGFRPDRLSALAQGRCKHFTGGDTCSRCPPFLLLLTQV